MEIIKEILQKKIELIEEASYFVSALENQDYDSEEDKEKLEQELEQLLKELGIELENE
tara:strand:- start:1178 stop:1351 length:174 start_codon:yes stop_codon:yes gene_type:complete